MKIKAGFSLEKITMKRIAVLADGTRRDKSTIVDMAIELFAQQNEFEDLDMPKPASARKPVKASKVA